MESDQTGPMREPDSYDLGANLRPKRVVAYSEYCQMRVPLLASFEAPGQLVLRERIRRAVEVVQPPLLMRRQLCEQSLRSLVQTVRSRLVETGMPMRSSYEHILS
ncbi:hypothetical protein EDF61_10254 [Arthrobacter sp. JUb115]|nr:hypothetical protein EDF61_10254 [Arthrobacter sp. JUb115]